MRDEKKAPKTVLGRVSRRAEASLYEVGGHPDRLVRGRFQQPDVLADDDPGRGEPTERRDHREALRAEYEKTLREQKTLAKYALIFFGVVFVIGILFGFLAGKVL